MGWVSTHIILVLQPRNIYFTSSLQYYILRIIQALKWLFNCLQDFFHQGMLFMMWFHNKLIKVSKKKLLKTALKHKAIVVGCQLKMLMLKKRGKCLAFTKWHQISSSTIVSLCISICGWQQMLSSSPQRQASKEMTKSKSLLSVIQV